MYVLYYLSLPIGGGWDYKYCIFILLVRLNHAQYLRWMEAMSEGLLGAYLVIAQPTVAYFVRLIAQPHTLFHLRQQVQVIKMLYCCTFCHFGRKGTHFL